MTASFWYSEGIDEKFHLLSFDRCSAARRRMEAILYRIRVFVSKRNEGDRSSRAESRTRFIFPRHPHFDDSHSREEKEESLPR